MNTAFNLTSSSLPRVTDDALDTLMEHLSRCPSSTPYHIVCKDREDLPYVLSEQDVRNALSVFMRKWCVAGTYYPVSLGVLKAGDMTDLWSDVGYALSSTDFHDTVEYLWDLLDTPAGALPRNLPEDPHEAIRLIRDEVINWYEDPEDAKDVMAFLNLGPAVIAALYVWAKRMVMDRMDEEAIEIMARRLSVESIMDKVDEQVRALIPVVVDAFGGSDV